MTAAERAQRVADIVEEALERESAEQASFLASACDGDAGLQAEVESLLGFRAQAETFIEQPAIETNADLLIDDAGAFKPGDNVGQYRVRSLIGEGGMGEVYLAEDTSLGREVAIKLVKRGFGRANLIRHFHHEERILAALNHPNIARLYGAGVADDGSPYFVMEYVAGQRLDHYCDERKLGVRERLQIFQKICSAVAYAHQHLIIHRDLKPANIRVTSEGEPKLLDFGIARLLEDEGAAQLGQTVTLAGAMTPEYASPEQVRGETMTTASDVYSLGVVLYELLTGRKPYRLTSHSAEEVTRAITTQSPVRPSVAVAERARQVPPVSPSAIANPKLLRGDLDNIVLMALRKEPERRYATVGRFADDIRRHLEARPVAARGDSWGYRANRFIARNRVAAAAAVLIALSLVGGIVATTWQAQVAARERDRAQRRFADVRHLSNALLFEIAPKIERLEGSIDARQSLVRRALEYLDSLAQESSGDPGLQGELAAAYEKIGDLQGAPRKPNLNDFPGAIASYEKARKIRAELREKSPADADNLKQLAANHSAASSIRWTAGDVTGALADAQQAIELYEGLLRKAPQSTELRAATAEARLNLAHVLYYNDRLAEVYPPVRASIESLETLTQADRENVQAAALLGRAYTLHAMTLSWDGKQQEGEAEMAKAFDVGQALAVRHSNDNVVRQALLNTLVEGAQLYEEVDSPRSYELMQQALPLAAKSIEVDAANVQARQTLAKAHSKLGVICVHLQKNDEAVLHLDKATAMLAELQRLDPKSRAYRHDIARVLTSLGRAKHQQKNFDDALASYEQAKVIFEDDAQADASNVFAARKLATLHSNIGDTYREIAAAGTDRSRNARAAGDHYRTALDILLRLQANNTLTEFDRQSIQQLQQAAAALPLR